MLHRHRMSKWQQPRVADQEQAMADAMQHSIGDSTGVPAPRRASRSRFGTAFGLSIKGLAVALAVSAGLAAAPRSAAAEDPPTAFIRALGNQAVAVIHSAMPLVW